MEGRFPGRARLPRLASGPGVRAETSGTWCSTTGLGPLPGAAVLPDCAAELSAYTLRAPDVIKRSAAELRRANANSKTWKVGQIERRGQLAPASAHQTLARHLCQAYNQAQRDNQTDQQQEASA